MSRCNARLRLLAWLSILEIGAVVFGQESVPSRIGNLRIIVFDPVGAVIPNAEVTFKGEKTISVNTGEDGSARVQLPYSSYSVTISRPGFKTTKITGFAIQAVKPSDLEVVLQLGHYYIDRPTGQDMGPQTIASDLPNVIEVVRVPDAASALRIAEPALIKVYGKRQIDYERPLTAVLQDGIWTVYGSLCCPDRKGRRTCEVGKCLGGVAALKLRQSDGKILSISHTK